MSSDISNLPDTLRSLGSLCSFILAWENGYCWDFICTTLNKHKQFHTETPSFYYRNTVTSTSWELITAHYRTRGTNSTCSLKCSLLIMCLSHLINSKGLKLCNTVQERVLYICVERVHVFVCRVILHLSPVQPLSILSWLVKPVSLFSTEMVCFRKITLESTLLKNCLPVYKSEP